MVRRSAEQLAIQSRRHQVAELYLQGVRRHVNWRGGWG